MGITWVMWNHLATPKRLRGAVILDFIYAYDGSLILIITRHVFRLTIVDVYCSIFY